MAKLSFKLASSKSKWLSTAGCLLKIKSILSAIPIFWFGVFWVPSKTVSQMEHLMTQFLWQGKSEEKKIHLVAWDVVSSCRSKGGLGIRKLRPMNPELLGKLI